VKIHVPMSDAVAASVLFAAYVGCGAALFALPRAVAPLEPPSLSLPRAEALAVMRQDQLAASTAPDNERTRALWALYLEQGTMERVGVEESFSFAQRREALAAAYKGVVAQSGEAVGLALRAKSVLAVEAALDLKLPQAQAQANFGALSAMLQREGASRDARLVVPRFLVRTFQKARWNLLTGQPADYSLVRVERRAFYGWQSLHVERVPIDRRIEALHEYGQAGGPFVEEALGVLLFRMGDPEKAAEALTAAYRKNPSLRLRNYAAGARSAAEAAPDDSDEP
jgi:tetratricopeptide (TPR) repeat protein